MSAVPVPTRAVPAIEHADPDPEDEVGLHAELGLHAHARRSVGVHDHRAPVAGVHRPDDRSGCRPRAPMPPRSPATRAAPAPGRPRPAAPSPPSPKSADCWDDAVEVGTARRRSGRCPRRRVRRAPSAPTRMSASRPSSERAIPPRRCQPEGHRTPARASASGARSRPWSRNRRRRAGSRGRRRVRRLRRARPPRSSRRRCRRRSGRCAGPARGSQREGPRWPRHPPRRGRLGSLVSSSRTSVTRDSCPQQGPAGGPEAIWGAPARNWPVFWCIRPGATGIWSRPNGPGSPSARPRRDRARRSRALRLLDPRRDQRGCARHPGRTAPVDQHPLHRRGPDRVVAPPREPPRPPHDRGRLQHRPAVPPVRGQHPALVDRRLLRHLRRGRVHPRDPGVPDRAPALDARAGARGGRLRDRARPPGRQADVPGRHPAERLSP